MSLMRAETLAAPGAVARCLAQKAEFAALAARLRAVDPPFVMVCARGSSGHVGTYLRVLLGTRLGLVAAASMPSIASVYHRRQRLAGALFIAISQSGRSPDLLAATESARDAGALTVAMVNDAASPLAAACEHVLDIQAGPERSVAATKTVLASLAAALALANAWAGEAPPESLPARLQAATTLDWSPLTQLMTGADRLFTAGRGPALGIVKEAALKLMETCGIAGLAYSTAELAHGPMALAGPEMPILAFLQQDASHTQSHDLLATLAARGAPIFTAGLPVPGTTPLPSLPPENPEADLLSLLLSFYLAAEATARARGLNPDQPPALQKITRTL